MILPGDAIYLRENLERNLLPPAHCAYDPSGMLRIYDRVRRAIRHRGATVLFSHDPTEFPGYRHAPQFYA